MQMDDGDARLLLPVTGRIIRRITPSFACAVPSLACLLAPT